jgi:hypothetical protein
VFAALAVSHWIENQTGWSIKKFVRTARRYRTVEIRAGKQTLTATDPLSDELSQALAKIRGGGGALGRFHDGSKRWPIAFEPRSMAGFGNIR